MIKALKVFSSQTSHAEKIISAVGGFVVILIILLTSEWVVGKSDSVLIVASMGASAVLVFAVPHGLLSQPWPVFGGHIISAIIGVTCSQLVTNDIFASSLAVGVSIGAMYYLKCIHPPGGATALTAVIGGESIHNTGYQFVLTPVLLNVVVILAIGVLFNYLFSWRRYPASLQLKQKSEKNKINLVQQNLTHEDFVYALRQIDSFVDATEQDLLRIYDLMNQKHTESNLYTGKLTVGNYYSNGKYGTDWSVRQIVDMSDNENNEAAVVIYKIVAGNGRRNSGYSSISNFLHWASYQVEREDDNWKKVD